MPVWLRGYVTVAILTFISVLFLALPVGIIGYEPLDLVSACHSCTFELCLVVFCFFGMKPFRGLRLSKSWQERTQVLLLTRFRKALNKWGYGAQDLSVCWVGTLRPKYGTTGPSRSGRFVSRVVWSGPACVDQLCGHEWRPSIVLRRVCGARETDEDWDLYGGSGVAVWRDWSGRWDLSFCSWEVLLLFFIFFLGLLDEFGHEKIVHGLICRYFEDILLFDLLFVIQKYLTPKMSDWVGRRRTRMAWSIMVSLWRAFFLQSIWRLQEKTGRGFHFLCNACCICCCIYCPLGVGPSLFCGGLGVNTRRSRARVSAAMDLLAEDTAVPPKARLSGSPSSQSKHRQSQEDVDVASFNSEGWHFWAEWASG